VIEGVPEWPELPSILVPAPARNKGQWDKEAYAARYKRQHRDLLTAAGILLGEKGLAKTTVTDIVARASVSKRTFYEHFASRDDCLVALLQRVSVAMARDLILAAQENSTLPPSRLVSKLISSEVSSVRSGAQLARELFGSAYRGARSSLSEADDEAQELLSRVIAVAARRAGSVLSQSQLELSARILHYALGAQLRTSSDHFPIESTTQVWCQTLGLDVK